MTRKKIAGIAVGEAGYFSLREATVLVKLKLAEFAPEAVITETVTTVPPKRGRTYKRRDMTAEGDSE